MKKYLVFLGILMLSTMAVAELPPDPPTNEVVLDLLVSENFDFCMYSVLAVILLFFIVKFIFRKKQKVVKPKKEKKK